MDPYIWRSENRLCLAWQKGGRYWSPGPLNLQQRLDLSELVSSLKWGDHHLSPCLIEHVSRYYNAWLIQKILVD